MPAASPAAPRGRGVRLTATVGAALRRILAGTWDFIKRVYLKAEEDDLLFLAGAVAFNVLLAMRAWGDRWAFGDDGPPLLIRHEPCGHLVEAVPACSHCGERLVAADLTPLRGPTFEPGPGTVEIGAALERREAAAR